MNTTDLFLHDTDATAVTHVGSTGATVASTFQEITRDVHRLTAGLARLGIGPGKSVLIVAHTSLEELKIIIAALRTGATVAPLSPLTGAESLQRVVSTLRPDCCIFDDPIPPQVESQLRLSCRAFVTMKKTARPGSHTYRSLLESATPATECADVPEEQLALIFYSSGSEGEPKAIRMAHADLRRFLKFHEFMHSQYAEPDNPGYPLTAMISILPLSHLAGLGLCLNALMRQRPVYVMSHFLAGAFLRLAAESRSRILMLVPSMYRKLLAEPALASLDLSFIRYCITLGEPCPPELAQQIATQFSAIVANAYGMTECFSGIGHAKQDLLAGRVPFASCGTHLFGDVKLVDESGNEDPLFGELWVRNETVRSCYTEPALNARRVRDGWYRTGDLFEKDVTGHFYHRGRSDDMFVCNGKNIYPVEIEAVLAKHPRIAQVCATAVQNGENKTVPAVLIVARQNIGEAEVLDFAARNGPSHAIPQVISFAERLPEVGPGKINRREATRILQAALQARPS